MHESVSDELKQHPICGDSNCLERYTFINKGIGIGNVETRPKDFH